MNETSKTQSAPNSAPAAGEQQSAKAAAANAAVQPQNVSDERKTFDAYWNGLDSAGATDAEIEMCEYAAWQAWQARPRHCLALPLSAYPAGTTYRAPATSAGGQRTDYYARFPEGESWAQVTEEQYEMAQRMGYDVRKGAAGQSDAGALEFACLVNRKLGDALAGRAYLLPADLAALKRFHECATDFDSGGHDVPKESMARLREIGAVQSIGFGRHQTTAFGDYVLERCDGEPVKLPLKTLTERNEDNRAAAKGTAGQVNS